MNATSYLSPEAIAHQKLSDLFDQRDALLDSGEGGFDAVNKLDLAIIRQQQLIKDLFSSNARNRTH